MRESDDTNRLMACQLPNRPAVRLVCRRWRSWSSSPNRGRAGQGRVGETAIAMAVGGGWKKPPPVVVGDCGYDGGVGRVTGWGCGCSFWLSGGCGVADCRLRAWPSAAGCRRPAAAAAAWLLILKLLILKSCTELPDSNRTKSPKSLSGLFQP